MNRINDLQAVHDEAADNLATVDRLLTKLEHLASWDAFDAGDPETIAPANEAAAFLDIDPDQIGSYSAFDWLNEHALSFEHTHTFSGDRQTPSSDTLDSARLVMSTGGPHSEYEFKTRRHADTWEAVCFGWFREHEARKTVSDPAQLAILNQILGDMA